MEGEGVDSGQRPSSIGIREDWAEIGELGGEGEMGEVVVEMVEMGEM